MRKRGVNKMAELPTLTVKILDYPRVKKMLRKKFWMTKRRTGKYGKKK